MALSQGGKKNLWSESANKIEQGSPTPGPQIGRNRAAQQEVSGGRASEASSAVPHRSHYHLNHPHPTPSTPCMEKLSSMKPVPGAKNLGTAEIEYYIT